MRAPNARLCLQTSDLVFRGIVLHFALGISDRAYDCGALGDFLRPPASIFKALFGPPVVAKSVGGYNFPTVRENRRDAARGATTWRRTIGSLVQPKQTSSVLIEGTPFRR